MKSENQFRDSIGDRKAEALIRLNEIISDIGEVITIKGKDGEPDVYIPVLTDPEKLREFLNRVERYRTEEEMYLDNEAAVMVSYLHDYLCGLREFIVSHPDVPAFFTGVLADRDIQMWSDEAGRIVIRDMNAANTEIEEHAGEAWNEVKSRIYDELHEKTSLYRLQDLMELSEESIVDTGDETDAALLKLIEIFMK